MNKRTKKATQDYADEHKAQWAADDKRAEDSVLKCLSEGAHLYVADQPDGPTGDVRMWTANLGMDKDAIEEHVVGRTLKALHQRGLIAYVRHKDEFELTERGREAANSLRNAPKG